MQNLDAIDLALRQTRKSGGPRRMAVVPLPGNMLELLKVAAEDSETLARCSLSKGVTPTVLLDSSRYALQKIILESGADHHRALGLVAGASPAQVRDHKRLLLKWLHPDRNHNSWESALFLRVQEAVEKLESGEAKPVAAETTRVTAHKKPEREKRKKSRPVASFRPVASRGQVLFRSAAIPALTIAAAAASIYMASVYGPSGLEAKASLFSLLQWNKQ
jgi:hypothetical protein